jgi:hypothetical protein
MTARRRWVAEALLRLAPAAWRNRYRGEVLAHLAESERGLRDAADLALVALRMRLDQLPRSRLMVNVAIGVLIVGIAWTAWAIPQLADGVAGLPGHWWSAPGPALVLIGALIALTVRQRRRAG